MPTPTPAISRPGTRAAEASSSLAGAALAVPTPAVETREQGPRVHVVVEGDTLSKISKKYYGTANRWEKILAANRSVIRNENSLAVGTTLTIP